MNDISYLFMKINLLMMTIRLKLVIKCVHLAIKSSRYTSDKMYDEYNRFLSLAEKREKLCIHLSYAKRYGAFPIAPNIPFNTGVVRVSAQAKEKITEYDRMIALVRHRNGDWGEIPAWERSDNSMHLQLGDGIVTSKYRFFNGDTFRVETFLEKPETYIRLERECV